MLIDRLHYALGLDTSEFKQGWASADRLLGSMDGKMAALATGAGIGALTLAIGKIGEQAVKMAMELGGAMNEVWSITNRTAKEMEGITDEILNISKRLPQSAPGLAKAYYQVISSGITDTSKALDVLEVSAKGATAGLTSTFTVVDAMTNVLNAYNRETADASEISDDLFVAVRDGKVTMEQLAPAIGQVVGTAALAKVELKEVLAAIVAMTLSGYSVEESATSINRFLLSIVDSQDSAKEAAKSLGIEWSVAGMQAKGFQQFVKELNDKAGDNVELLQAMVPEIRAFRAAAVIAGTGADAYARSLENLKNSAGATNEALAKIMSGTGKQWEVQKNRYNAAMIELGQKILPAVSTAVRLVNDAFEGLGLAGETEAKRLQREWGMVGEVIKSVGDLAARSAAIQTALSTLMAPGQSPMQTFKTVEEMTNFLRAYPAVSERAKEIQTQAKISTSELVEALQAELQALKDIDAETRKAQLQGKQQIVSAKQLADYQAEITRLKKQAEALGETGTAQKLAEISESLAESAKTWTDEKLKAVMADRQNVVNQIALATAAEAAKKADEEKGKLAVDLVDTSRRLMVSETQLIELDKIRVNLAKKAAEARGTELSKMKAMGKVEPSGQWMPQSSIQTTDRGKLPYGAFPMPKTSDVKAFKTESERLWKTFVYGEDAAQNFASAGMKLVDVFLEGDQTARGFAEGLIKSFEGAITRNPLDFIEGVVDIFGSLFSSSKKAGDATKELTERIAEYTDQLKEMTYAQLVQQMNNLVAWWNSLKSPAERAAYKDLFNAQVEAIREQLLNFGKWGNDFTSMIERWNYELQTLNIDDPVEKFQRLVRYAKQYLGIDMPTEIESGFAKVKMFLDSLGAGSNIKDAWQAAFGMAMPTSLTDAQLRELVQTYMDAIQAMQEAATEAAKNTGATKTEEESVAFSKTKQITYRQADEMTLALWSIDEYARKIFKVLNDRLTGGIIGSGGSVTWPAGTEIKVDISDLISRLNIYATNTFVNSQNCIVDVSKANVYLSGTSYNPETYSSLIANESTKALRSQGLAWVS
ncbi:MAG TPA: phage tail tape measure protein [bacterium]|nr:phage tail tape measure protein [bacterium]HQJ66314.1 phage tail tape measure protein [bacterium]